MSYNLELIPVHAKIGVISADLNATMLSNYLMGIYTTTYIVTMYLCSIRKPRNMGRIVILATVSLLYILSFGNFILQWYYIYWCTISNGLTRESTFSSTIEGGPTAVGILGTALFYSVIMVADGLLIWRCYHIWGQCMKAIYVPLILMIGELGLFLTATTLSGFISTLTDAANVDLCGNIYAALMFTSLGTTLLTTFLIGKRLHNVARLNGPTARKPFKHITFLFIESCAAYSVLLVLFSLCSIIPAFKFWESPLRQSSYYVQTLLINSAGIFPTILVARLNVLDLKTLRPPRQSVIGERGGGTNASVQIGQWRNGNDHEHAESDHSDA